MASAQPIRPLAIVTGASSGIGFELARCCAENGFDLLIAADDAELPEAADKLRAMGASVETVQADLATTEGVDELCGRIGQRPVDALLANAGHGLGRAFLDQEFSDIRHVIDTNVTGTIYLIHTVGRLMRDAGRGRILITGSVAGYLPSTFQAVYGGTKAFLNSFSFALRNELHGSGVTVTCLMPGATETNFFVRADMVDTSIGSSDTKDDAAEVAQSGFEAMMKGEGDVVTGWSNKLMTTMANVLPSALLAAQHRRMAEPGTANR